MDGAQTTGIDQPGIAPSHVWWMRRRADLSGFPL